nr:MAG TPA: hypothetical protein [Caudoviricetes sp.]
MKKRSAGCGGTGTVCGWSAPCGRNWQNSKAGLVRLPPL